MRGTRCLADLIVSHAFSHGLHPEHCERLAAYWSEALGGPSRYSDPMGDETHVVRIHSGNGDHPEMDDLAEECFALAIGDAGLSDVPRLRITLQQYFHWANATMSSHPHSGDDVTDGLGVAQWDWNGPR